MYHESSDSVLITSLRPVIFTNKNFVAITPKKIYVCEVRIIFFSKEKFISETLQN